MERDLNIEVPGIFMNSFVKSLNRGNIPISIYIEDPPKELYYIKLVYDENYVYIGIKYDIDKPQPGEVFKTYVTMPYFHLPPGIQSDIVSRTKQKNCIGFLLSISAGSYTGGFSWQKSPEGHCFWEKVLDGKKYDIYFEKFPKAQSIYDESITGVHYGSDFGIDWSKFKTVSTKVDNSSFKTVSDTKCNDTFWIGYHNNYEIQKELYNLLKIEENESRLQKQEDPLRRGNSGKPVKLHTGKHKIRIAVKHLSHTKVLGRG